ncbi:hypothetical protein ACSSS7_002970 [Eimeria intestinalis]
MSDTNREAPPAAEGRPAKMQRQDSPPTGMAATTAADAAEPAAATAAAAATTAAAAAATTAAEAAAAGFQEKQQSVCTDDPPLRNAGASRAPPELNGSSSSSSGSSSSSRKGEVEAAWAETEHQNWRVNSGVLYDVVLSVPLDWPSLTVEWLPGTTPGSSSSTVKQRLLLGTHTSGAEADALVVMQASPGCSRVELPTSPVEEGQNEFRERGDYEGFHFGLSSYKVKIVKRLPHPQESNCARHMPQRPSVIASCAVDGRVLLYDLEACGMCEGPEAFCVGHKGEATCVSWNPQRQGHIASCGSEGTVEVHDAGAALSASSKEGAAALFSSFRAKGLNSCCWFDAHIFLAAAEDGVVALWDTRADPKQSAAEASCGDTAVNSVTSTQLNANVFLCGSDDGNLHLFDRRKLPTPVHEMHAHGDSKVSVVGFSLHAASLLISGGYDHFVSLWDLEKIGDEQDPEDAEDGPPELLDSSGEGLSLVEGSGFSTGGQASAGIGCRFTHGGHRADVYDAAWNCESIFSKVESLAVPSQMVASVADDNKLQIWSPKASVFFENDSEDEQQEEDDSLLE